LRIETDILVFLLATFLGIEVIRRVSPMLHTPLMSLTNAISAISVIGAIEIAGRDWSDARWGVLAKVLAVIAVALAFSNVVGGYLITDRMLKMFKKSPVSSDAATGTAKREGEGQGPALSERSESKGPRAEGKGPRIEGGSSAGREGKP
jgi:H+-translocating NAD(P) transhydrogenase subunit alpha